MCGSFNSGMAVRFLLNEMEHFFGIISKNLENRSLHCHQNIALKCKCLCDFNTGIKSEVRYGRGVLVHSDLGV